MKIPFILLIASICTSAYSQRLEAQGDKDEKSVSIKMRGELPSSRVIVESSLKLSYKSNMGDLSESEIGRGVANSINSDTLYFYLPVEDNKRRVTISADGFSSVILSFSFQPKETYRYVIFDPSKYNSNDDFSALSKGDSEAQFTMGKNYDLGTGGFDQNEKEAIVWYRKAAEQGYSEAQYTLGLKYASGSGAVAADLVESAKWYLAAANQNNAMAQYIVAGYYAEGKGLAKSQTEAYRWYLASAERGLDKAQYKVATLLRDGNGVEKNTTKAMEWATKSANQNNADAQYLIGLMIFNGEGVTKEVNTSVNWLNKAVEGGNTDAMIMLGSILLDDTYALKDVVKAVEILRKAEYAGRKEAGAIIAKYDRERSDAEKFKLVNDLAQREDPTAMADLGFIYYFGLGVEIDYAKAFELFTKSAAQNIGKGVCGLGLCYASDKGTSRDYSKAFSLLEDAMSKYSYPEAGIYLGDLYLDISKYRATDSYPKRHGKAISAYRVAASNGSVEAENRLGILLIAGYYDCPFDSIKPMLDFTEGERLLKKAASKGYWPARFNCTYWLFEHRSTWPSGTREQGVEAAKQFRDLANEGYTEAIWALAEMAKYEEKTGVTLQEVYAWWKRAAENDNYYKAILGSFIVDNFRKLDGVTQEAGIELLLQVADEVNRKFVYKDLYYYYSFYKKDRKQAKYWDSKRDAVILQKDDTERKVTYIR